jgi:hypothetical protein
MKKRIIDVVEIPAVIATMFASVILADSAAEANFILVYTLFLSSSAVITVTTYLRKSYNIMALNFFYVTVNSYALFKEML